ncbi:MAG: hypothetical protein R6U56_00140 [Opitutales bacterium]
MDKSQFFNRLIETLREECMHAVQASKDAADYATNEESRAESRWDTQGLEASYLAAGQAGQARQWAESVEKLQSEREDLLKPRARIGLGALFCCDFGTGPEWFFFAGMAGGHVVPTEQGGVTVVTSHSPLAGRLLRLMSGASFTLANGNTGKILSVE